MNGLWALYRKSAESMPPDISKSSPGSTHRRYATEAIAYGRNVCAMIMRPRGPSRLTGTAGQSLCVGTPLGPAARVPSSEETICRWTYGLSSSTVPGGTSIWIWAEWSRTTSAPPSHEVPPAPRMLVGA